MVTSNEISIVVQGPIVPGVTRDVLQSVRKALPGGEIILSTWQESDVAGLEYDKMVFSKDPGAVIQDTLGETSNNINRQIVTSQSGLKQVTRQYVLKLRSDILLCSASFLKEFGKWDQVAPPLHVKSRMLVCSYYTRDPRVFPLPFHPSDWILFGYTEDVRRYFSTPLEAIEEIQWFRTHSRKRPGFYAALLSRYVPEQYLCLHFVEKFEPIEFDYFDHATEKNIIQTERILAGDFVVLDYRTQCDILFTKYNPNKMYQQYSLLSHRAWQQLFYQYCLGRAKGIGKRRFCCFWKRRILILQNIAIKLIHLFRLRKVIKWSLAYIQRKKGYRN